MGPALGGFLYALGPGVVFGLAGGSFALASVLTLLIRFRPAAVSERPPITWAALSAGIDYIRAKAKLDKAGVLQGIFTLTS